MYMKGDKMSKKIILICIIVVLILIIFILALLLGLVNSSNINNSVNNNNVNNNLINNSSSSNIVVNDIIQQGQSNEVSQDDNEIVLETTKDYSDVKIHEVYIAIKNISEEFFETISSSLNGNQSKLYSMLGKEYISRNNLTENNIKNAFSKYNNSIFHVNRIKQKIIENNICIYIVYGTINGKDTYNMAVVTDETNMKYCIYPFEYLKEININNFKISNIPQNEYNSFVYKDVNKEQLSNYHLEDIKYYAQYNVEELYKKLDSEYSKKRFESLEKFREYIKNNLDTIKNISLVSYRVTRNDDDTVEYSCIDNYGKYYIFKEASTMQYSLMLDNYTIMTTEDLKYYNELDEFDKSKYNLVKFINMVNMQDYNAIYNSLDNTFKNNNFKNVNDLQSFIQKNMYNISSVEIDDIEDNNKGVYGFSCIITNMNNTEETKTMTVIINQSEGTDFTMSFNFN